MLGSWVCYARQFLNFDHWDSVWFEHSAPEDPALLADYQEIFHCEVLFDQPASGIRIRESLLDEVLPQANGELLEMLLAHATKSSGLTVGVFVNVLQPLQVCRLPPLPPTSKTAGNNINLWSEVP